MLVTSIKYCGKSMNTMGILEIENGLRVGVNPLEDTLTAESSILTFIVAFSYHLLRLSKENTLCRLVMDLLSFSLYIFTITFIYRFASSSILDCSSSFPWFIYLFLSQSFCLHSPSFTSSFIPEIIIILFIFNMG